MSTIIQKDPPPIQLKTAYSKGLLKIFDPDKDHDDPYLIKELDEETAREYIYSELIWRVTESIYPKLRPFFPAIQEEVLKVYIVNLLAHDKVKEKIQETYGVDILTYVDITEEDAQQITDEILNSTGVNEIAETIRGALQDQASLLRWLQQNRGRLFGLP